MTDLSLGNTSITLTGTVNNYAAPIFEKNGGAGSLSGSNNIYSLNFGTLTQGQGID